MLILDVGHGNATIIKHLGETVVIDSPLKEHLVDALKLENVDTVRLAIASHSDSDHCGGFIGLLLDPDIVVRELRINSDATRSTKNVRRKFWEDLKVAWLIANKMHGTSLRIELTDQVSDEISFGSLQLEVLYPPPELAIDGVGSTNPEGRTITPNAMSAVIRVSIDSEPLVLLPGDMDSAALDYLTSKGKNLRAQVLVFPHHGGFPEGATSPNKLESYVSTLMSAAAPANVIFSIGRGLHNTPRPEIVKAVRQSDPSVHVACTQLSNHCSAETLHGVDHVSARYAAGRRSLSCCMGTATLTAAGLSVTDKQRHQDAIQPLASRLCN